MIASHFKTPCLSFQVLDAYTSNNKQIASRHRLHLEKCPLCQSALEGYSQYGAPSAHQLQLAQLEKSIITRTIPLKEYVNT